MKRIPEPNVIINGTALTETQAGALRVALQFARRDFESAPKDLLAAGLLRNVDAMLALIDETPVAI